LVAITPASVFGRPAGRSAADYRVAAGVICYWGAHVEHALDMTNSLDAFACMALAETVGAIP